MKPETAEDILELLQEYIASATVGAAMKLGLFGLLAEKPLSASNVAKSLNIPGQSRISLEDYAVAMLDELENPKHIRQRFTVGY